jgi:hypothetical protein
LPTFDDAETADAIRGVSCHPLVGYSRLRNAIADILVDEVVGFKNEAFAVEKEWRVVVRQRLLMKQTNDDGGKTKPLIHIRSSEGTLVPYVKLKPTEDKDKLPIACIRSGPTLDKTTSFMPVVALLERNGFAAVPVRGSNIPVRLRNR